MHEGRLIGFSLCLAGHDEACRHVGRTKIHKDANVRPLNSNTAQAPAKRTLTQASSLVQCLSLFARVSILSVSVSDPAAHGLYYRRLYRKAARPRGSAQCDSKALGAHTTSARESSFRTLQAQNPVDAVLTFLHLSSPEYCESGDVHCGFLLPRYLSRWLNATARAVQGPHAKTCSITGRGPPHKGFHAVQSNGEPRSRKMCDIQLT